MKGKFEDLRWQSVDLLVDVFQAQEDGELIFGDDLIEKFGSEAFASACSRGSITVDGPVFLTRFGFEWLRHHVKQSLRSDVKLPKTFTPHPWMKA